MLVVIGIVSLLVSIGMSVPKADKRRLAVEAAARELAGTLRLARNMAIERQAQFGVCFNISNAPGTTGQVINNWSGGHWYQILGPRETGYDSNGLVLLPSASFHDWFNVAACLRQVSKSWYAQRTTLPTRAVRFLALSDQDNGVIHEGTVGAFPPTFPRPWFGWFDTASGRLHPWGGYDASRTGGVPTINLGGRNCTGLWYEGIDGAIPDSRNPADRTCSNAGTVDQSTLNSRIFVKGQSRPLVNGDWMDAVIRFQPDGTVSFPAFGQARWYSYRRKGASSGGGDATIHGDLGDLTPPCNAAYPWEPPIASWSGVASHFVARTGYWFITLAPDAEEDRSTYASAADALRSISPMYRVGINAFGDVRVIQVRPEPVPGTILDTSIAAADWQNAAVMQTQYRERVLTDGGSPAKARGSAIIDAVNPRMLESRAMWAAP